MVTHENLVFCLEVTSSAWFTLELEELSFYSGELLLKCLYCLPVLFLQVPDLISEVVPESFILGCQLTQRLGVLCFDDHVLRLYCAESETSACTNSKTQAVKHSKFYISKFLQFEAVFNFHVYDYLRTTMCATFFSFKVLFLQGKSETEKATHYLLYECTVLYKLDFYFRTKIQTSLGNNERLKRH